MLHDIFHRFTKGELSCGETKKFLITRLVQMVGSHQEQLTRITERDVQLFYAMDKAPG